MKSNIHKHLFKSFFLSVSKKFSLLLLLFTVSSGFAFSPPDINPPPETHVCQGIIFDLTAMEPQILNGQDSNLYSVSYYNTQIDADAGTNPILNPTIFLPFGNQYVYIRVEENANPSNFVTASWLFITELPPTAAINGPTTVCSDQDITIAFQGSLGSEPYTFEYTINGGPIQTILSNNFNAVAISLPVIPSGTYDINLIRVMSAAGCSSSINEFHHIDVVPTPTAGQPLDLFRDQPVSAGNSAQFDLTDNFAILYDGQTGMELRFYASLADAESGTNQISPLIVPAYGANSGTQIWVRVQNATTGCFTIRTFRLFVTHPGVVFIPDPNFKARLLAANGGSQIAQDLNHNYTSIDSNGDGEIQFAEAANITLLDAAQSSINDFTGLEAFTNMVYLNTSYNYGATYINVTTMPFLESLVTYHCAMTDINLANNHNLNYLSCEFNNLLSLDLSGCPLLTYVHCQNNLLVDLNLEGLTQLNNLWASDNHIVSIYTADLHNIAVMKISNNEIPSLDLTGLSALQDLNCEYNFIDSLNTADCPNLTNLRCAVNQMTYLDVSHSPLLSYLDCNSNTYLNLDLSQNPNLCSFNCAGNNTMNSLNIKNGVDTCYTNFNVMFINNVLQQFCCDENEVAYFKNYFLTHQGIDVNVNSYCSFTPGGDYNTISVTSQFDANNNGCDTSDSSFPNVRFNINDGTNSGAGFTGITGVTQFYTQAGSFTITPNVENPSWYTISPTTVTIPFSNTNNNTVNQNFCIAPNGVHPDVEVVIAPTSQARPGFNAEYAITFKNKGNQIVDGVNTLNYDASKLDFLAASQGPDLQDVGVLYWDFGVLQPFESRTITVIMRVHAPTDASPVNLGDELVFNQSIITNPVDENNSDNLFELHQIVVGSFDPNEIVCLEGNIVSPVEIGNYLHYTINFENTGTADAENIVVREVIDTTQFDVNSLQLLNSSASVTTRITSGNIAEFIFPSINLRSGGHGNILLKIRTNNSLVSGDTVSKKANIYFDYNFPVETVPENTIFQALSTPDVDVDATITLYPNPTKGVININCNNNIKSVQLYDVQGRILQTNLVNENQAVIDVSSQPKGVYFLKIISDKGMEVKKIVRE